MKSEHEWRYDLEACDVEDKGCLRDFRSKADIWIRTLDRVDRNSVSSQIHQMMWEDATWRSLNHARFLAVGSENVGTPGIVASLLDRGYIAGQAIYISRLIEKGSRDPQKQINSLRRLVDEICDSRHLLTREVYICRDGLPYNVNAAIARMPLASDPDNPQVMWLDTEGPNAWAQSIQLHEEFDRLSGIGPETRSRGDLISTQLFDRMKAVFNNPVLKDIQSLRHKSIAHAADLLSRSSSSKDLREGISLDEIGSAHYLLLGLYQVVSANILYQSWLSDAVPVPMHDVFEGMEKPIAASDGIEGLWQFWDRHCNERSDWLSASYRELIPKDFTFEAC